MRDGGTIVALGDSVETVREMFELPITPALPKQARRGSMRRQPQTGGVATAAASERAAVDLLEAFQSPANLMRTLDAQVDPFPLFDPLEERKRVLVLPLHPVGHVR